MTISIRTAATTDAAGIADVYNIGIRNRMATFETRERAVDDIVAWLHDDLHPVFVATSRGQLVGWIAASEYRARNCYLGIAEFSVYVHPDAQQTGVGSALMMHFLEQLSARGYWKVVARVFPENEGSLALCRRNGFRVVGTYERHAQLDGVWRDVVIVERLLTQSGITQASASVS